MTLACDRCNTTDRPWEIAYIGTMWLCNECWGKRKCDECGHVPREMCKKQPTKKNRALFNQPTVDRGVLCWRCM